MNKDEINEALAEALEIEVDAVEAEKALEDYQEYDSLALLTLLSLLEDGGVRVNATEIDKIVLVSDLYDLAAASNG